MLLFNHMVKSSSSSSPVQLDQIFHALSDRTRRAILRNIARGEKTVSQIAEPHRMSLAAVSKHLKVLERADLLSREKRGSFQFIRAKPKTLKLAQQWISYYEQFWSDQLDRLEQAFKERKTS